MQFTSPQRSPRFEVPPKLYQYTSQMCANQVGILSSVALATYVYYLYQNSSNQVSGMYAPDPGIARMRL